LTIQISTQKVRVSKFLHNSFREYFFAELLAENFRQNDFEILRQTFVSIEVAKFLLESIKNVGEIISDLKKIILTERGTDYLLIVHDKK
jgi:hypothetical protein